MLQKNIERNETMNCEIDAQKHATTPTVTDLLIEYIEYDKMADLLA